MPPAPDDLPPTSSSAMDKFKAPAYSATRPDMFFAALESQFRRHKVDDEEHRYSILINSIDLDSF
jgi:hypothetical protein